MEIEMEGGGPSSKRIRSVSPAVGEDGEGEDRISALPDDPLHQIISLLPTKDGARTRILASRWRHLWRSAPLNLDCNDLAPKRGFSGEFAGFVSGILSSHLAPARRFCVPRHTLYLRGRDATVDAWIRSPALDNLQELDLSYTGDHPLSASTFRFSATLRVVTIGGCDLSDSTVQALHFPLLKQLGIEYVSISECSLHSMIASCPVLECLFIRHAVGFRCIRINSPSLKSIGILDCGTYRPRWMDQIQLKELIIESAPCLEKLLDLSNYGLHASVLFAPKLEILGFLSEMLRDLKGVNLSTRLVFGSTVTQGLGADNLAMVARTVKILGVNMKYLSLDRVIELMGCFPCLEKLYIRWYEAGEKNLSRCEHPSIIRCSDIRLKTIVVAYYQGYTSEVNFATFFVLNAKVLELMMFQVTSTNDEFIANQKKKLQLERRASRGAQFHFIADSYLREVFDFNHVGDLDLADPLIYRR
uniref:Uncharacterized protein n=1 Tax=Avena sativa TaxID=4498 RepID=A0ACD5WD19_AVESA